MRRDATAPFIDAARAWVTLGKNSANKARMLMDYRIRFKTNHSNSNVINKSESGRLIQDST